MVKLQLEGTDLFYDPPLDHSKSGAAAGLDTDHILSPDLPVPATQDPQFAVATDDVMVFSRRPDVSSAAARGRSGRTPNH